MTLAGQNAKQCLSMVSRRRVQRRVQTLFKYEEEQKQQQVVTYNVGRYRELSLICTYNNTIKQLSKPFLLVSNC